jgi:hypothetical protein
VSGLRERIANALIPWLEHDRRKRMQATDAVLRVLAEHGDTQQVRTEIRDVIEQTTGEPIFPPTMDAVMAVVAPIVAARDAAVEQLERYDGQAWEDLRADLAAARQQLDQVRALVTSVDIPEITDDDFYDTVVDIRRILDTLARRAPSIDAAHIAHQREWSTETFGPGLRLGVIDHIRKELIEVEAAPADLGEWVDVIILGLDGAWRAGHEPQAIIDAIKAKQARNEARTWPDWRTADRDMAIEHDRSLDAPAGHDETGQ